VKILNSDRIFSTSNLNIDLTEIRTTTGKIIEKLVIDPVRDSVVAVTCKNNKILLIQTKRFLWDKMNWELPNGFVNDGEIVLSAVRRNVVEETGHEVSEIVRLGSTFSDISMVKKEEYYFLVEVGDKRYKFDEDLVYKMAFFSMSQVRTLIKQGKIMDNKTITGLMLAENKGCLK